MVFQSNAANVQVMCRSLCFRKIHEFVSELKFKKKKKRKTLKLSVKSETVKEN